MLDGLSLADHRVAQAGDLRFQLLVDPDLSSAITLRIGN